jgi:hypothetical protein
MSFWVPYPWNHVLPSMSIRVSSGPTSVRRWRIALLNSDILASADLISWTIIMLVRKANLSDGFIQHASVSKDGLVTLSQNMYCRIGFAIRAQTSLPPAAES